MKRPTRRGINSLVDPNKIAEKKVRRICEMELDWYTPPTFEHPILRDVYWNQEAYRDAPLAEDIRNLFQIDPFTITHAPCCAFFKPYIMIDTKNMPFIMLEQHVRLHESNSWHSERVAALNPSQALRSPCPPVYNESRSTYWIAAYFQKDPYMNDEAELCRIMGYHTHGQDYEYRFLEMDMGTILPLLTMNPHQSEQIICVHINMLDPVLEIDENQQLYIAYRHALHIFESPYMTRRSFLKRGRKILVKRNRLMKSLGLDRDYKIPCLPKQDGA